MAERTEIITNCLDGKMLSKSQTNEDGVVSLRCGGKYVPISLHFSSTDLAGRPHNLCHNTTCKRNKHNPINIDSWS